MILRRYPSLSPLFSFYFPCNFLHLIVFILLFFFWFCLAEIPFSRIVKYIYFFNNNKQNTQKYIHTISLDPLLIHLHGVLMNYAFTFSASGLSSQVPKTSITFYRSGTRIFSAFPFPSALEKKR